MKVPDCLVKAAANIPWIVDQGLSPIAIKAPTASELLDAIDTHVDLPKYITFTRRKEMQKRGRQDVEPFRHIFPDAMQLL